MKFLIGRLLMISLAAVSFVGCSGEDFGAVLSALGFRPERQPFARQATEAAPADGDAAGSGESDAEASPIEAPAPTVSGDETAAAVDAAPGDAGGEPDGAEPQLDEIWRPKRRKPQEARQPRRTSRKGKRKGTRQTAAEGKASKPGTRGKSGSKTEPGPKRRRSKEDTVDPDSPFAALAKLKRTLEGNVRERA